MSITPHRPAPPTSAMPSVPRVIPLETGEALAIIEGGQAVVLVDRAVPEITRLLARNVPPRTALRRWVGWISEILPLVRQRRRQLLLVERRIAETEPQRVLEALVARLGDAAGRGMTLPDRTADADAFRPDPVLEVIAQALVAADPAAQAADAEIAALLLPPEPAEPGASAHAQLALASAAMQRHVMLSSSCDTLRIERAALAEAQRLAAEQVNLLARSRAHLSAGCGN